MTDSLLSSILFPIILGAFYFLKNVAFLFLTYILIPLNIFSYLSHK